NWEHANTENANLRNEISALRQGRNAPRFDIAQQMDVMHSESQQLREQLDASAEKIEIMTADIYALGKVAVNEWKTIYRTWDLLGEHEFLATLGPVGEEIEEVMGRYFERVVEGVEVEEEEEEEEGVEGVPVPQLEQEQEQESELDDFMDEEEDVDPAFEGNTTTTPAQVGNIFTIPSSTFRGSWRFEGVNPFTSTPDQDHQGEDRNTIAHLSSRLGNAFTAPSASSSSSSVSLASYDDELPDDAQNQRSSEVKPSNNTDSYETISLTETSHQTIDLIHNANHVDLADEEITLQPASPPSPSNALIVHSSPVEAELMTQSAYRLLFYPQVRNEWRGDVEWGHEYFVDQRPQGYMYAQNEGVGRGGYGEGDGGVKGEGQEEGDVDDLIDSFAPETVEEEGDGAGEEGRGRAVEFTDEEILREWNSMFAGGDGEMGVEDGDDGDLEV
ncbi:MAG: hypothetical protein Q9169_008498, partial [Polycauliona sp. 2 TL-2023]